MNRSWTARSLAAGLAVAFLVAGAAFGLRPISARAHFDAGPLAASLASTATAQPVGRYLAGDVHTHTWLSDGVQRQTTIAEKAFRSFGLGFMANSDHGGASLRDPYGRKLAKPMWRSAALKKFSFPIIRRLRAAYPGKRVIQGVEWFVPGHDHASVGIVTNEPTAVGDFDYQFDARNHDTSTPSLVKHNGNSNDAVRGAEWLEANYPGASYLIVNHPSRKLLFTASSLRDLNDAAPSVCFGFEGVPGHQRMSARGEYQSNFGSRTKTARTYGGADYMLARVGGAWDSLLGEGRHFWAFGNSDFHRPTNDFWPGEYTKNITYVTGDRNEDVVAGLRGGNSLTVTGGIVNALQFRASNETSSATMGQTVEVPKGSPVDVTVRFRVPQRGYGPVRPSLDHIDLIGGEVHAKAATGTPERRASTNASTRIIKRFRPARPWKGWRAGGTWYQVTYRIENVQRDSYLRLRGTNLGLGVRGQTDKQGNPLVDVAGKNSAAAAWADCWMYSNPIFIKVTP